MNSQEAADLIKNTFDQSFDEDRFTLFVKNLLNDVETKHNAYRGNLIKESFREHIVQYKRIGKYLDPNNEALDVLLVEVADQSKLDKARTTLRNFVISHLDNFEKNYALVAFYAKSDGGADWRFSFVKLEYRTEVQGGKIKQEKDLTPAKRYSFLVGEHEKSHTAKKQLLPLLQNVYNNPTLDELEAAFSIEAVTDEFFDQYKSLFVKLAEHFEKDERLKVELNKSGIDVSRFAKKLLGQIVFLYFLQKKGWLGVAKNAAWGTGSKRFLQDLYTTTVADGKNFFGNALQYLFYEALATDHSDESTQGYYARLGGRIPFLNGGLFEADYGWETAGLTIPDHLFRNDEKLKSGDVGTGVLDVFDRYNFTIKEDEPLDKEVAVDPEMLGRVFENMLEVTERKSKGAFYTPREIVHYMCQESMVHYLDNAINNYQPTYQALGSEQLSLVPEARRGQLLLGTEHSEVKVPVADLEEFIRRGFFYLENDGRVIREGRETRTYSFQLPESVRTHADELDQFLATIKICDPAIGSGAFPVGLLLELVNAQLVLRQYLSPTYFQQKCRDLGLKPNELAENEIKYTYRLKRHSIQESIYGVDIDPSAIDIARLRLWLSLVVEEDDLDNIEALPNLDYKIVCGNSLIGLPETAMRDLKIEEELEGLKEQFFVETRNDRKKELRNTINAKIRQLLDSAEQFAGYKIDFDFKLFFSEVWREKKGFDIVIGNPPYGGKLNKNQIKLFRKIYTIKTSETAILFIEKAFEILNKKDRFSHSFIIPKSFAYASNYASAREMVKNTLFEIVDCGTAFKSVKFEAIIIINKKCSVLLANYRNKILLNRSEFKFLAFIPKSTKDNFGLYLNGVNQTEILLANNIISKNVFLGNHSSNTRGGMLQSLIEENGEIPVVGGKEVFDYGFKPKPKGFVTLNTPIPDNAIIKENSILVQNIVAHITNPIEQIKIIGCIPSDTKVLIVDTVNQIVSMNGNLNKYWMWIILHSEVVNWYAYRFIFGKAIRTMHFDNTASKKIPIPKILTEDNILVGKIIYNYLLLYFNKNKLVHSFFSGVMQSIVHELYFPDKIQAAGKEILKHLGDLQPLTDDMSEEQKLSIVQSEFERLYDPNHPVRNAVETLDSVEEVRIIKEALRK